MANDRQVRLKRWVLCHDRRVPDFNTVSKILCSGIFRDQLGPPYESCPQQLGGGNACPRLWKTKTKLSRDQIKCMQYLGKFVAVTSIQWSANHWTPH